MGKKTNRMSMSEKQGYLNSQADKYGINDRDYYDDEGNDNDRSKRDDIIQAMNSDYDLRESMKYGRDSGNKYFDKVGTNISNINDAVNAGTAVDKYGKEIGQKNTSSSNDYANISSSLFKASREQLTDSMTANEQQDQAERGTAAPVSRELQDARDTVDELGNKDYDIFGTNIDNGDNQNQRDQASQAFLGKYKLDLKKDKNFQPVLPS